MPIARRELLKAAAAAGALLPFNGLCRLAFADTTAQRGVLVVLFLRGACDGLGLVAPVNDPHYRADRAPDLWLLDSGDHAAIPLAQPLGTGLDFRLHPAAAPLADIYAAGQLAIVHAVGSPNASRSHFAAQALMERGVVNDRSNQTDTGWLTRVMRHLRVTDPVSAVSATPGVAAALRGFASAQSIPDLNNGVPVIGGAEAEAVLTALYRGDGQVERSGAHSLEAGRRINDSLPRTPNNQVAPYQPEHGASYNYSLAPARGLAAVARLIKMELGLVVACVDMGGWDTHAAQAGPFSNLAGALARGLAAFWNDLADYHDRITLVVMTEFGRRLRSNLSLGTDHGHGSVMLVLGGGIEGGRMYGNWPGLASEQLDRGVDLAVTTDFRTVLGEVLEARLGVPPSAGIFPDFTAPGALGLARRAA